MMEPTGKLLGIYIHNTRCQILQSLDHVQAIAGLGLEGDRYFLNEGCFSNYPGRGRNVTLIEKEALDSLDSDERITAPQARRNLLTENVDLNSWVGRHFKIGDIVLRGDRLCHPCEHLQMLTKTPVLRSLKGRGGLRADIVIGGQLALGMTLTVLPKNWLPDNSQKLAE